MSYQRVRTPRFYIDIGLFARHHGIAVFPNAAYEPFFKLNPSNTKLMTPLYSAANYDYISTVLEVPAGWTNTLQYMAVLGHDFYNDDIDFRIYTRNADDSNTNEIGSISTVNCNPVVAGDYAESIVNGYSLIRFNKPLEQNNQIVITMRTPTGVTFNMGDVTAGWMYDMPHSPDLSLKLSYQNESVKSQSTKGGHTLTNSGWSEPPYWGNLPQWMTNDNTEGVGKYRGLTSSSRRTYDLSFSFLDDTDLLNRDTPGDSRTYFGVMQGRQVPDSAFAFTGLIDSFYSKVVHGTANFKLPFIFQPDKEVDEFAIVKIDSSSYDLTQTAPNVYNTSMKLVEVW